MIYCQIKQTGHCLMSADDQPTVLIKCGIHSHMGNMVLI